MKGVVLAAGKETRLCPLTVNKPKTLVEVNNKPILIGLEHAILQAESHVDEEFILMLGDDIFRANLGDVVNR